MFFRKLCFFTVLATLVGLGTAGSPKRASFELNPWKSIQSAELLPRYRPIQTRNTKVLSAGKLLVASRDLGDPNFAKTVVLLVQYDHDGGVVGLVLNRRSKVPLSHVLADLKAAKDRSDPVYLGGPVETPSVFALLKSPAKVEGADHVVDGIYLIAAKPLFEQTISTRPDPAAFRVYLGYAGWTAEQLQMEVELGAWFIFPADSATVFNTDPDALWPQMIRTTEMKVARNRSAGAPPAVERAPSPSRPMGGIKADRAGN